MEFEEFKEYLFLFSSDVDEELNEIEWAEGIGKVREWIVRVLQDWQPIAKGLTHKQQDKLLWRIGCNPMFIGFWLKNDAPFTVDEQCELLHAAAFVTLSIPELYNPEEPIDNGYYMWWDFLAPCAQHPQVSSVCLDILSDLSRHQDPRVYLSALHGLGHLQHPGRPAVVDEFIRRHPEAKDDDWILQCRDGTVM